MGVLQLSDFGEGFLRVQGYQDAAEGLLCLSGSEHYTASVACFYTGYGPGGVRAFNDDHIQFKYTDFDIFIAKAAWSSGGAKNSGKYASNGYCLRRNGRGRVSFTIFYGGHEQLDYFGGLRTSRGSGIYIYCMAFEVS